MAQDIASELTQMGSLVVTGIVAGCDLSAARGALETGQPLVCVLARRSGCALLPVGIRQTASG